MSLIFLLKTYNLEVVDCHYLSRKKFAK